VPAAKIVISKNYPKGILHDEKHLYKIILAHLALNIEVTTSNTVFTNRNTFRWLDIEFKNKCKNLKFCLSHLSTHPHIYSLTTFARLETKQSSTRTPFYNKRINSLVGCIFWSSDEHAPPAPCHTFYLSSYFFKQ